MRRHRPAVAAREDDDSMIQLQCTIFSDKGYRPISTIIKVDSMQWYREHEKEAKTFAIKEICNKRCMQVYHLKQYGYTKLKVRLYDKKATPYDACS